jgi:hypothetical protein
MAKKRPTAVGKALMKHRLSHASRWCPCCNKVKMTKFKNTYGQMATNDHIIPVSLGGFDVMENLRVICMSCNNSKGNDVNLLEAIEVTKKIKEIKRITDPYPQEEKGRIKLLLPKGSITNHLKKLKIII